MKILMANYEMENFFGGTQTWTVTMYKALRELGHEVHVEAFNPKFNTNFLYMKRMVVGVKYDVLIANGNQTMHHFQEYADKIILMSHGVLPKLEQPVAGADIILGVSEEVAANVERQGFKCDGILRNPIDRQLYAAQSNINGTLKTIVLLDRRRKFPFIEELKKEYKVIELGTPPRYDLWSALQPADLVIARGRGIYEAMSMQKNVIVSGNNSGRGGKTELMDGFVTPENFLEFRKNNCSGRNQSIQVTSYEQFKVELDKYDYAAGAINHNLIAEHNDSVLIANQLLSYL